MLADTADLALLGERELSRLRWRCRRGMLENDLFVERFLLHYSDTLTVGQARCLNELMELSDNDLLDLHLGRKTLGQVDAGLERDDMMEILDKLREKR